jgi:hypothetical protein
MEEFTQLFGNLLAFVYHCFDRMVIHGYLSGLSRPEQVVYFVREVLGLPVVSKEVLSQRTGDYRDWVEAYARNHHIPIEWAEKGVRKEDYVSPRLHRLVRKNAYGVYFIFKSMEQGRTFRISVPKHPTQDPNYRILAHQRSRFTHYYFYIRDEVLGPIVLRVASFFPFHATYWLNGHSFIEQELNRSRIGFHKSDNAFLAVDDVAALQAAADRLSPQIIRKQLDYWTFLLGPKFSKKERHQMNLSRLYAISQIEYCRNFIFKRHFPIHKIFEPSCEIGLWRLTAKTSHQHSGHSACEPLCLHLARLAPLACASVQPHRGSVSDNRLRSGKRGPERVESDPLTHLPTRTRCSGTAETRCYLVFRNLPQGWLPSTVAAHRRIWMVNPYVSAFGKASVAR